MRSLQAFSAVVALGLMGLALAGCGKSDRRGDRALSKDRQTNVSRKAVAAQSVGSGTGVRLVRVGSFDSPLYVTAPPGDRRRVFVVGQNGQIWVIKDGRRLSTPFLNLASNITSGGEQGLLSMAFAPDYAKSGKFYVYYTNLSGDTRVVEYRRVTADRASTRGARTVLRVDQPESNHNGGLILFGPDKLLYVGLGDGGGGNDQHGTRGNAQNLGSLLGKILRIDPKKKGSSAYTVPLSNPFVRRAGARREIYSYGLRNPWRFSFDRSNGDLIIGDVGQNRFEEINFLRKGRGRGANFGWRPWEANFHLFPSESAPGRVRPVIVTSHSDGNCSITGGVVVRDRALKGLYGRYVFSDYCNGRLMSAKLSTGRATGLKYSGLSVSQLSSFGEDARERVYAISLSGAVYRLANR